MTARPHDTDRILAVLGEAIERLRYNTEIPLDDLMNEVANDLALLHGAVSAEAQQADPPGVMVPWWDVAADLQRLTGEPPADQEPWFCDKGGCPGHTGDESCYRRAYAIHREEIADEVLRGEHRDDDWREDG
jgi:hypothetical protein